MCEAVEGQFQAGTSSGVSGSGTQGQDSLEFTQLAGSGVWAKTPTKPLPDQLKDKSHKASNRVPEGSESLSPREQKQRKFLSYKREGQAFQFQTFACVKQNQE